MEPTIFQGPAPYGYLVLDIETDNGRPEAVEAALRARYLPPSNMKTPAGIGRRWLDFLEDRLEKLALADQAPVRIVSLKSETELRALHCLEVHEPRAFSVDGHVALVEGFESEAAMLVALRDGILDQLATPETELAGHNIEGFDLRKLRYRFCASGLQLPHALRPRAEISVFDTMRRYGRHFSKEDGLFVSLDFLLREFGIPSHKGSIDGSMVPQLIAERRFIELIEYALRDVLAEERLYLRMDGQLPDGADGEEAA